jgi:hypothetical protein
MMNKDKNNPPMTSKTYTTLVNLRRTNIVHPTLRLEPSTAVIGMYQNRQFYELAVVTGVQT